MGIEIERKYLVAGSDWQSAVASEVRLVQGYLAREDGTSVRVRLAEDQAFVTIKGARDGISRAEFEYPIPVADAGEMLDRLAQHPLIEKTRHLIPHGTHTWELDVFEGENAGLVTAEIELASVDEAFELPSWVGADVSDDKRYSNVNLVRHPFTTW